uniref:Uncharacterized protein n=1 Tax=Anopheles melas TaxID=34690 RepID=A0A182TRA4_9DIPT
MAVCAWICRMFSPLIEQYEFSLSSAFSAYIVDALSPASSRSSSVQSVAVVPAISSSSSSSSSCSRCRARSSICCSSSSSSSSPPLRLAFDRPVLPVVGAPGRLGLHRVAPMAAVPPVRMVRMVMVQMMVVLVVLMATSAATLLLPVVSLRRLMRLWLSARWRRPASVCRLTVLPSGQRWSQPRAGEPGSLSDASPGGAGGSRGGGRSNGLLGVQAVLGSQGPVFWQTGTCC